METLYRVGNKQDDANHHESRDSLTHKSTIPPTASSAIYLTGEWTQPPASLASTTKITEIEAAHLKYDSIGQDHHGLPTSPAAMRELRWRSTARGECGML
jgi:hypothetical protein